MLIRLIIFAAAVWFVSRIVRNLLGGPRKPRPDGGPPEGTVDEMVQDPVCGTYVPARDAHRRVIGGRVYHFCSERCADLFERRGEEGKH